MIVMVRCGHLSVSVTTTVGLGLGSTTTGRGGEVPGTTAPVIVGGTLPVTMCPVEDMVDFEDFNVIDVNAPADKQDVADILKGSPVTLSPGEGDEKPTLEVTLDGEEPAVVLTFEVTAENAELVTVTLLDEDDQPLLVEEVSSIVIATLRFSFLCPSSLDDIVHVVNLI